MSTITQFAEIIFEDGSHSILSFDDESELKGFLEENHRRAINGEPSAPQDMTARADLTPGDFGGNMPSVDQLKQRPAFRTKKVFVYDQHPADLTAVGNEGVAPVKVARVKELVEGMSGGGEELNMHQLVQALRDEASPVLTVSPGRFESHYKMDDSGQYDLSFLKSVEDGAA